MRNVRINEAETIFETFWDSGESYPNHHKYTCLSQYKLQTHKQARIAPSWWSVEVTLDPGASGVEMERDCHLEITDYDIFRLFASVSQHIAFKVICRIDGEEKELIHAVGNNTSHEYNGKIDGRYITNIRFVFENTGDESVVANLLWLGLSNEKKEQEMLQRESPYTPDWEGCFCENPRMVPQDGLYFDSEELVQLRKKLAQAPFARVMELMRDQAREALSVVPEQYVGNFVHKAFRRFIRDRDEGKPCLAELMQTLAFVGIIDENSDMLKMACRMALSVAHCRYFCESIMGVFPGATWHHRSFTEEDTCKALVKVLDWAGGFLTWHGKNIIYDAIIMKGLPRLDADIKTMDYIWTMNQGAAFVSSLVIILISLSKRYPRYLERVDEAERDMLKMWEMYSLPDGGSAEGPQYWSFTLGQMTEALQLLARLHNTPIAEYAPKSIKHAANYALALLSDNGDTYIPVNDAHMNLGYSENVLNLLASIEAGEIWKLKCNQCIEAKNDTDRAAELLIFAESYQAKTAEIPEFITLDQTGHMALRRTSDTVGRVGVHLISGAVTFGHAHGDKGSIVMEIDGKQFLPDRGICGYDNPNCRILQSSQVHNITAAVRKGEILSQETGNEKFSAKILKSEYRDGLLIYSTDVTAAWNGMFKKNIRTVISPYSELYIILDELETQEGMDSCFILNAYAEMKKTDNGYCITDGKTNLAVYTPGRNPKADFGAFAVDGEGTNVNRLCIHEAGQGTFVTILELFSDEPKLKIADGKAFYQEVEADGTCVRLRGKEILSV